MAKIIWKRQAVVRLVKAIVAVCVVAFLLIAFMPSPEPCKCDAKVNKNMNQGNELGHNIDPGGGNQHRDSNDRRANNVFGTQHKLAVIIPFRDRYTEMLTFVPHIHKYLNAKSIDHKIFVVNQIDDLR